MREMTDLTTDERRSSKPGLVPLFRFLPISVTSEQLVGKKEEKND